MSNCLPIASNTLSNYSKTYFISKSKPSPPLEQRWNETLLSQRTEKGRPTEKQRRTGASVSACKNDYKKEKAEGIPPL